MSLEIDVFGHQLSLDMQDVPVNLEVEPTQEVDQEEEVRKPHLA